MSWSTLVLTPAELCDPQLAIAATRAGAWGILDLGLRAEASARRAALARLRRYVGATNRWGLRWDTLAHPTRPIDALLDLLLDRVPLLIVAGLAASAEALPHVVHDAKALAGCVFLEAYSAEQACAAQAAGFDGVILVGNEAGGCTSAQSSFLLLQQLHQRLHVPLWVRGGLGLQTAAAARLAGASGIVLAEQLWLAEESPWSPAARHAWRQLDGSESVVLGDSRFLCRVLPRGDRRRLQALEKRLASGDHPRAILAEELLAAAAASDDSLLAVGQEIALAASLADRFGSVRGILQAFERAIEEAPRLAHSQRALAAGVPLATTLGTTLPLLQGPMAWVSDAPRFCQSVAAEGALPFLALAGLQQPQLGQVLAETAERLGERFWGVGLFGSAPAAVRRQQWHAVRQARPRFALLAGGRPSQAAQLEADGIATFLSVPSPRLLAEFLQAGVRRFVFAGSEGGGPSGPRTSFALWQGMIDVLLQSPMEEPERLEIVFAGGIHDELSAAMVAVLAAPLVARGMKIGLLMGTAYLFTPEAVADGAVAAQFQRTALACQETMLLVSDGSRATRAAQTPAVEQFMAKRRALVLAGKTPEEIRLELELFPLGRLRLATKGLWRQPAGSGHREQRLVPVDEAEQHRRGLYLLGDVATLHDALQPIAELHRRITAGSQQLLEAWAPPPPAVQAEPRRHKHERLAIVGIGCLFPDSPELKSYWGNILRSFNTIREVPPERWRAEDHYHPGRTTPDRVCSARGSFLGEMRFDPFRYRIPPASIPSIEPIQLLALEVARHALEDAGYGRRPFPQERTSVIVAAAGTHDLGLGYAFRVGMQHWLPQLEGLDPATREAILQELKGRLPTWTEDSFAGFLLNVVAGRIANRFNLRGSNFTVDAACASSLAALQVAAEQLRSGTCDAALVGAVDGTNNPFCFMSFAKTYALSPKRSCPFDEHSDGINLGEGIAALVLKRLSDAERDGDRIYAVLAGIGSSSDGPARSMTAPNPEGQELALARAYADAGVSPRSVTLVEAHSTGTPVGDQVEVSALARVFSEAGAGPRSCAIGSVKSMIGHTKTAAGLASLIKTTLALKHKVLPPTLGVERPNAPLRAEACPFLRQ